MLRLITLPTPFPVGPVNVYLAEGDPLTLIDTGPKWGPARAALEAGLAEAGCRIEDLRRLILTHHHADHVGLAGEIVARSGAEVVTHTSNRAWLADYCAERARHRPFFQALWAASGVPADIAAAIDDSGADIGKWQDPVATARGLEEGDLLDLAGAAWRVYHTPGHAGGLICLWEPASRTLLANDHVLKDISSNPVLEPPAHSQALADRPRRLEQYLHHLRRAADLAPALTLPGHGAPVDDVPALVRARLVFHERRKARLVKMLAAAGPQTLWELVQATFGARLTRGMDWFLGCSEILGHLDLLETDGVIAPHPAGAVTRWAVK
ncbi:MAG: MBL fold metallo-hydrolase [Anaerolineales bacterium]|nr:MBL fold metallo-hydrolase [Anaerolineales bacterium]